jgi:hypothetical protein
MPIRRSPNGAGHTVHSLVAINRNRWSRSIGIGGRNQSESVVAISRYAQRVRGHHHRPAAGRAAGCGRSGPPSRLRAADIALAVACYRAQFPKFFPIRETDRTRARTNPWTIPKKRVALGVELLSVLACVKAGYA